MIYKAAFDPRQYKVMMLREHHKMTFREISEIFGVSRTRAGQPYSRAKIRRKRLYADHICKITGCSQEDMKEMLDGLWKEFGDNNIAIAYLEREYKDILDELRSGEPESSFYIDENTPRPKKPHPNICKTISISSYRMEFSSQELLVLQEHDQNGVPFDKIGILASISEAQAKSIYQRAKLVQFRRYVKIISEKTGTPFESINNEAHENGKKLSDRIEYLKKEYGHILSDSSCEQHTEN